jgi:hypothetical protein
MTVLFFDGANVKIYGERIGHDSVCRAKSQNSFNFCGCNRNYNPKFAITINLSKK